MKLKEGIPLGKVAEFVGAQLIGNPDASVTGINEIHKVQNGDITYVDFDKYYEFALNSAASYILIDKQVDCPESKSLLISEDPFEAYNKLTKSLRPFIIANDLQSNTAQIGEGTIIQPNVFIGNHVKIGKNCIIHPNVTIYDYSEIGDDVIIHANTVIGCDAFYYKGRKRVYEKMHTVGKAIIEDRVEIGSGCTISSGVSGDTIIGAGSKLDNLIHIGHGTVVGKNCLMAAQVAVAGKTNIGDHVILYGKVGVSKDLTIGDHVTVLASSNVGGDLEEGKVYYGSPAIEARQRWREKAIVKKLPGVWKQLERLLSANE